MRARQSGLVEVILLATARLSWKSNLALAAVSLLVLHRIGELSPFVLHYAAPSLSEVQAAASSTSAHPSANGAIMSALTHEIAIGLPAAICFLLQFIVPPTLLLNAAISAVREHRKRLE